MHCPSAAATDSIICRQLFKIVGFTVGIDIFYMQQGEGKSAASSHRFHVL
jgi:hypothetical protein